MSTKLPKGRKSNMPFISFKSRLSCSLLKDRGPLKSCTKTIPKTDEESQISRYSPPPLLSHGGCISITSSRAALRVRGDNLRPTAERSCTSGMYFHIQGSLQFISQREMVMIGSQNQVWTTKDSRILDGHASQQVCNSHSQLWVANWLVQIKPKSALLCLHGKLGWSNPAVSGTTLDQSAHMDQGLSEGKIVHRSWTAGLS